jgi:hydroxyacylglutathione hydrolase
VREVADGVLWFQGRSTNSNAYLLGDVLVDSGTRWGAKRLLRHLDGRDVRALAFTHVHPPTQGAARTLVDELGLEVWCAADEKPPLESGNLVAAQPPHAFNRVQQRLFAGPGCKVDRILEEGDVIEGFEVLHVPGHAPGHLAFWRAADRTLLVGDVVTNANVWTGMPGLREPPRMFTPDPPRNRESARRLAALSPRLVLFAHGKPCRDDGQLEEFVSRLDGPGRSKRPELDSNQRPTP